MQGARFKLKGELWRRDIIDRVGRWGWRRKAEPGVRWIEGDRGASVVVMANLGLAAPEMAPTVAELRSRADRE